MNNCKYSNDRIVLGIEHEFCTNEELKELNKSEGKDFHCMGRLWCGRFERNTRSGQGELKTGKQT